MTNWRAWGKSAQIKDRSGTLDVEFFTSGPFVELPDMKVSVFRPYNEHLFSIEAQYGVTPDANRKRLLNDAKRYIADSDWLPGHTYSLRT